MRHFPLLRYFFLFCFVLFCFVLFWFGLVWFGLVWFGLVWFGLVWFGFVWFGLVLFVVCLFVFVLFCSGLFCSFLFSGKGFFAVVYEEVLLFFLTLFSPQTCFFSLTLPEYSSKEVMQKALLRACECVEMDADERPDDLSSW